MEPPNSNQIKILKALADPKRLRIVTMLSSGELCACKLLKAFSITQPTLSHDMKVLIEAGLVKSRPMGKWTHYSLDYENIDRFYQQLGRQLLPTATTAHFDSDFSEEVNIMERCKECGIYDEKKGACYHFTVAQEDCAYFTPIQFDDDERISPENHWRFKIADMKSRSMQGPV